MKNKKEKGIDGDYTHLETKILIRTAAVLFGSFALISAALGLLSGRFSSVIVGFLELFYKDYDTALIVYTHMFRENKEWFVMAAAFGVFLIVLRLYLKGFTKYFNEINGGINALKEENSKDIVLSSELAVTEKTINTIKHTLEQQKSAAKAAEQRKNDLVVYLAHDLKTPLSPIKGYAELLMGTPTPDKKAVREYGGIILKSANHTEKMMNDLKLTYQLDSGAVPYHPQTVRLVRFLKELVIDIVNDPAFANRRIGFESNIQECEVCLDIDLFRRAVNNLIINALTHNPPETEVTIRIDSDSEKNVLICISDNGTGMSDKEQSKLFNRYYRGTNTKEKPEGSGLGLAIAKQIITLHGGNIDVRSRLGEGTCFTIILSLGNP